MRIALLVAGQPRTMEFCFPSLKKHILDVYAPDVFLCSDEQEDRMRELFCPVKMDIQSQQYIDEQLVIKRAKFIPPGQEIMPHKDLSIAWKVWRANEMKKEFEQQSGLKYDLVLLTRFDVKFAYVQPIDLPRPNTLYVPRVGAYWDTPPDYPGIHWHGYSAHLCWMDSATADRVTPMYFEGTNIYQQAQESSKEYGWVPEYTMRYFLEKHRIDVKLVNIDMMLIRGTDAEPLAYNNTSLQDFPAYR